MDIACTDDCSEDESGDLHGVLANLEVSFDSGSVGSSFDSDGGLMRGNLCGVGSFGFGSSVTSSDVSEGGFLFGIERSSVSLGPFDVLLSSHDHVTMSFLFSDVGFVKGVLHSSFMGNGTTECGVGSSGSGVGSLSSADGVGVSSGSVNSSGSGSFVGFAGSNPEIEVCFSHGCHTDTESSSAFVGGVHGTSERLGLVPSGLEEDGRFVSDGGSVFGVEVDLSSCGSHLSKLDHVSDHSSSESLGFLHLLGSLEEGESVERCTGRDGGSKDSSNGEFHVESATYLA